MVITVLADDLFVSDAGTGFWEERAQEVISRPLFCSA